MNYKYSTLALAIVALLTGCGAEDNKDISGDNSNVYAPVIKGDVTIPALHVGYTAKGAYQYFDPNPVARPEGKSQYSWRDANDAELGTEQSLTLTYELQGENIKFCVQPVAQGAISATGDEECSAPRIVEEQLGEKPLATNVALDNTTPTVGDTLNGRYNYSHSDPDSEGTSLFTWYAGSSVIPGASTKTLTLLPDQTEGKAVKFCVSPVTNESMPVRGDETCSVVTDAVLVKDGSAPIAENTAITGDAFVGASLTGGYDFTDADGDKQGASTLVWKRDGSAIADATSGSYLTVDADENKELTFCVTPIAATGNPTDGVEDCSEAKHITKKNEEAPVAADVTVIVKSGGMAEAGEVLVSGYTFQHADASEGASVGVWKLDGAAQPECDTARACEFPLTQANVGQTIGFCVTPKTALGTPGLEVCSADVSVNGIKISGALEYDKQLTAVVYGYTGDVNTKGNWLVDVSNQDGPDGNLAPTSQGTGTAYTIGTRATVTVDGNGNGIIDDYDWKDAGNSTLNAGSFVGKDIQFCLTTTGDVKKCVSAADSADVTGGMFVTVDNKVKRVIEPVRELVVNSDGGEGHTYHRPLTVTEAKLKEGAGFGANIPDNSAVYIANGVNGINWALFQHKERDLDPSDLHAADNADIAVNVCRNLYSDLGEWYLPITYKSNAKYDGNYFAHANSNAINAGAPSDNLNNYKALAAKYFTGESDKLSPVFGWPVGNNNESYPGASVVFNDTNTNPLKNKQGQFHRYRFNGGNTSTVTASTPQLILCVK